MKKDLIFSLALVLVGALLFLLKATGLTVHIAVSVIGILVLAAYTVACKKEWKIPALEILMRAFYGIALITGIVVMNSPAAAIAVGHKVCAALFLVLLVVLSVLKLRAKK